MTLDQIRALVARYRSQLLALLAGVLAAGTIAIVVDVDGPDGPAKPITVTIKAQTPLAAPPAGELDVGPADAVSSGQAKSELQLRDETPDQVPTRVLDAAEDLEQQRAETLPPVTAPLPVGGAQNYRCRRDFSGSGYYGQRRAADKVMSVKLHYTVSPNITGWADILGVNAYLKRVGLSAHLIVDFEGNCLQQVPWERNAFTQGAFNSTSDSIEIIATGRETRAQWLASPLIRKGILASIIRDRLTARGLPRRFVDPVGCADQLGYTDHEHLECGNTHTDVAPAFPFDVLRRQLLDGPGAVTITDRVTCSKLRAYRRAGRPRGGLWEKRSVRRRQALDRRGVACYRRGPVKR